MIRARGDALCSTIGDRRLGQFEVRDFDDVCHVARPQSVAQNHEVGIGGGSAAAVGDQEHSGGHSQAARERDSDSDVGSAVRIGHVA